MDLSAISHYHSVQPLLGSHRYSSYRPATLCRSHDQERSDRSSIHRTGLPHQASNMGLHSGTRQPTLPCQRSHSHRAFRELDGGCSCTSLLDETCSEHRSDITAFNSSALTATTDLRPALDLVVATRIYGASPPPWSDGEYAFPTISLPLSSNSLKITASINTQAAYLVCTRLDKSKYSTVLKSTTDPEFTNLVVTGNDRGCNIGASVIVQAKTENYLKTFFELGCGSDVGSQRFSLVLGTYSASSPTLLRDFSIISCIPQYWTISGHLELIQPSTKRIPVIGSFVRNTTDATELGFGALEWARYSWSASISSSPSTRPAQLRQQSLGGFCCKRLENAVSRP